MRKRRKRARAERRSDPGGAFFPEPEEGPVVANEEVAETLSQEYLSSATSGEEVASERRDELQTEELGGPFVETTDGEELSHDNDER